MQVFYRVLFSCTLLILCGSNVTGQQGKNGAYNSNYLTYLFDTVKKKIVLLNYEYIEQDVDKRYKKLTTWKPIGFSTDPKTQSITLLNRYYGAAQCGWEAYYKIVEGKPVLKGMRAAWDCDPGTDYDKWPKLNLSALRKKSS